MAKRIAILIFDGFSLAEASSIAEVFRLADEIEGERLRAEPAPARRRGIPMPDAPDPLAAGLPPVLPREPAEPYALVVMSSTGGSIASSATMRVWSDNLDAYAAVGLHALIVPGGREAARLATDESFLRRLRAVMAHTDIVKAIGTGSAIVAAAAARDEQGATLAPVPAPFAAATAMTAPHGQQAVAIDDPFGPIACALWIVKTDRGAQAAREIADRSAPGARRRLGAVLDELDGGGTHEKIEAAARWIRENFVQPISVAKAAEVAQMSERSFLRRFKSQIGITPSEYLLRARLDATCRLLVSTDLPVDKIARRCGVGSGDGLAKMFRKRLSISPTEYRIAERRRSQ